MNAAHQAVPDVVLDEQSLISSRLSARLYLVLCKAVAQRATKCDKVHKKAKIKNLIAGLLKHN